MNRRNLTAAVLAGLAGVAGIASTAQAVNVNPDGIGQVLLYPYYTTNKGNITVLSVVNTTALAKAVKVRFLEGENSQEVLDFNLYLSAYDVWAAAITPILEADMDLDTVKYDCDPNLNDANMIMCEGPILRINDDETTCTVPNLNGAQAFLPYQYIDGGTIDQARGNEGHFEMLEMGTLGYYDASGNAVDSWAGLNATHVNHPVSAADPLTGWAPLNCDALVDAWTEGTFAGADGRWIVRADDGVEAPSGGLFGGGSIVNVPRGAMHSYDATALNGWNLTGYEYDPLGVGTPSIHAKPGTVDPNLQSGDTPQGLVFSDQGMLLDSGEVEVIDAVSFVLMHNKVMNEYSLEKDVLAQTEWVLTFPTKRFYVDRTLNPDELDASGNVVTPADPSPFTTFFEKRSALAPYATACETVELDTVWDREERTFTCENFGNCPGEKPPVVSPPRPGTPDDPRELFELCYETNVIRFGPTDTIGGETELLGSPVPKFTNIDAQELGFEKGWARIELDDYVDSNGDEKSRNPIGTLSTLDGLPVLGFSVSRFDNNFLPGPKAGDTVLSAYGSLFDHKASIKAGSAMTTTP